MKNNYQGVTLPKKLLNIIDEIKEKYGFTSKADFIKQAIRNEIKRLAGGK